MRKETFCSGLNKVWTGHIVTEVNDWFYSPDIDECLMGGVKCEQQCVNTPGDFYCDCYQGYHKDDKLPHKCMDIDECLEGRPDCHKCFNLEGR